MRQCQRHYCLLWGEGWYMFVCHTILPSITTFFFWKGDNVVSVLWSFYHINASVFFRRRVSNVVYVRSSQDHISRHYLLLWKGRGSVVYVCLLYILTKICSLWLYIFSSINNNSWPPYSLKRQWISPVRIAVLVIVKQELHTL